MIFSDWQVPTEPQRDTIIDSSNLKITGFSGIDDLTQSILSEGVVLVYMRFSQGTWLLPYASNAGGTPSVIDFIAKPGIIILTRFTTDNSGSVNISASLEFRWVLIPGGVPAGANVADYEEIQSLFGIPD